jgi:hypothetical protein
LAAIVSLTRTAVVTAANSTDTSILQAGWAMWRRCEHRSGRRRCRPGTLHGDNEIRQRRHLRPFDLGRSRRWTWWHAASAG